MRNDHVYHKFGTGNYKTLWSTPKEAGRDPRDELIKWWERNYCARRMKLAVVGREDVDTLQKWVETKFAKIPVRTEGLKEVGDEHTGVRVVFDQNPIGEAQMAVSVLNVSRRDSADGARRSRLRSPFASTEVSRSLSPSPTFRTCTNAR